jgi:hypothetical protein
MRSVVRRWWWPAALAVAGILALIGHLETPFATPGAALLPALAACALIVGHDRDRP